MAKRTIVPMKPVETTTVYRSQVPLIQEGARSVPEQNITHKRRAVVPIILQKFVQAKTVTWKDIAGESLGRVMQDLQLQIYRFETIHSDECYADGRITHAKKILAGYKRSKRPSLQNGSVFKDELTPCTSPIYYPENACFGPVAYRQILDNRHSNTIEEDGISVRVFEPGMFVTMRKEEGRMVFRPCNEDNKELNIPLVGRIDGELIDLSFATAPLYLYATKGDWVENISSDDIEECLLMLSFEGNENAVYGCILVIDKQRELRRIDFDLPKDALFS